MWRVVPLIGLASACSFAAPVANGDANGDASGELADAPPVDGTTITGDAACMIGSLGLCMLSPTPALVLAGAFDSDTDVRCRPFTQPGGRESCLLYADSISIAMGTTFTAHGTRPLLLASRTTVVIDGVLDVSSRRNGVPGAGANDADCQALRAPEDDIGGAAGGAGGSYLGRGGNGGVGDQDDSLGDDDDALAGLADAALAAAPTFARGGCPGSTGGDEVPAQGGRGGASGGAVWIAANGPISIGASGAIRATGAGGGGGQVQSGGGGGGSGGLVVIEAPTITVGGQISANGGGGGEGGTRVSGTPVTGNAGSDGELGTTAAAGGSGAAGTPGDGGAGSAGAALGGGTGGGSIVGAGGGGGGAGFIRLVGAATVNGVISPPAS